MTEFNVNKNAFRDFLKICSCEGTIKFREKKAIKIPLFSCFYLDVKKEQIIKNEKGKEIGRIPARLEVLTIDTVRKKIQANLRLEGIKVIEDGIITISDYKAIIEVLAGKGLKGMLNIKNDGTKILIESDDGKDGYEIRQEANKNIKIIQKNKTVKYLDTWRNAHKEDANGILVYHAIHPKTKQVVEVPFSTKLEIDKKEILKSVDDTVRLTKDNKTKIMLKDGILKMFKGEANAKVKGRHIVDYENKGSDLIEFEEDFYNIQTLIPNMFDKITLNIRRVDPNNKNFIAIIFDSVNEDTKISMRIGLSSIIAGEKEEKD